MKITPNMLHEDLQGMYWPMRMMAGMLSTVWGVKLFHRLSARSKGAGVDGLHSDEQYIPSRSGGPDIRVRIFKPRNAAGPLPGFLYLHGGGYVTGVPEIALDVIKKFIEGQPCVIVAPDYRKALAAPYPAALNDCYDTLLWMKEYAGSLGIVPDRFIVGGHSAGGGLTAAVALKAADTGDVDIAFQLPLYPMIDDRQDTPSAAFVDAPVWNAKTNKLGWGLYLQELLEKNLEIPAYAAPARAADYAHLPPTITFVGDMEPFRDETLAYVDNLKKAEIPVTFKLFTGCFHGFDAVVPEAEISRSAWRFVLDAFADHVQRYF